MKLATLWINYIDSTGYSLPFGETNKRNIRETMQVCPRLFKSKRASPNFIDMFERLCKHYRHRSRPRGCAQSLDGKNNHNNHVAALKIDYRGNNVTRCVGALKRLPLKHENGKRMSNLLKINSNYQREVPRESHCYYLSTKAEASLFTAFWRQTDECRWNQRTCSQ